MTFSFPCAGGRKWGRGVRVGWGGTRGPFWSVWAGYSQNSSKITHTHKNSHLVNITFCFCLYFSSYTTRQFVVLCHSAERRVTNIWLTGHIPFPAAPRRLWDKVFSTYQLRWKTRVFLENNGVQQGILLPKIPLNRLGLGKLTRWLPPKWTWKTGKSLDAFAEWPVMWIPVSPQRQENLLNNNNEVMQTLQSF